MKVCLWFLSAASVVCLFSCDRVEKGLEIEREYRSLKTPLGSYDDTVHWKKLENGLYRSTFRLPPSILHIYPAGGGGAVDPFAEPVGRSRPGSDRLRFATAKEILENAGITFEGEASATYDRKSQVLSVDQTEEMMELVEAYFGSVMIDYEKQLYVRAEVYELSSQLAQEALESASSEGDHSPERNAVFRAMKDGRADLVAASALIARSGQRAKVSQLRREIAVGEESESEDEAEKGKRDDFEIPIMEFEVDPVLGADEYTIDLNLSLKLSKREAGMLRRESGASSFQDDEQSVVTMVTMKDGLWLLVGNWAVEDGDRIRVVFLCSSIQVGGGYSQLATEPSP